MVGARIAAVCPVEQELGVLFEDVGFGEDDLELEEKRLSLVGMHVGAKKQDGKTPEAQCFRPPVAAYLWVGKNVFVDAKPGLFCCAKLEAS